MRILRSSIFSQNLSEEKRVLAELHGRRLDDALVALFGLSKSAAKKAVEEGQILRNGKVPKKAGEKVKDNDKLRITNYEFKNDKLQMTSDTLAVKETPNIIFENDEYLVVEKPIGIPTHFDRHHEDCLVARLLAAGKTLSHIGAPDRPGVVHRIDKDTSGILLFAKTDEAHRFFQKLFASRKIKKTYFAVVHGGNLPEKGTIDSPIARDPRDRKKMRVAPEKVGRASITHFRVLENRGKTALVEIDLATGRTHQIRVHFAAIGHPVVGDPIYGDSKRDAKLHPQRLFLHAAKLEFSEGGDRNFEIQIPEIFAE